MALQGQAKTDYQREYMRAYRAKNKGTTITGQKQGLKNARGLNVRPELSVRPTNAPPVRPIVRPKAVRPIKTQSHSPMMVGYVPPGTQTNG